MATIPSRRKEKVVKKILTNVAIVLTCFVGLTAIANETIAPQTQLIKEANRLNRKPANPKFFTGKAEVVGMTTQIPGMPVHTGIVIFEPAARTFWHIHPAGQIFPVLEGEGRTGAYGEKARVVKPGDVVICPAGVKHFHGAGPETQMVQMTVTGDHPEGKGVTWLEEVTDEQYNNIEK